MADQYNLKFNGDQAAAVDAYLEYRRFDKYCLSVLYTSVEKTHMN